MGLFDRVFRKRGKESEANNASTKNSEAELNRRPKIKGGVTKKESAAKPNKEDNEDVRKSAKKALDEIGNERAAQAKKPNGIKEIKVKTSNIEQIRIGFTDPAFGHMLGSGAQFDSAVWGTIGSVNPELAKTLLAEPRDGPYSGGYRVLVSVFRQDSMDQLMKEVADWSHGMFSNKDIIVQKGALRMTNKSTGTVQRLDMIIVSVLESGSERPTVIIGDKLVIIPA